MAELSREEPTAEVAVIWAEEVELDEPDFDDGSVLIFDNLCAVEAGMAGICIGGNVSATFDFCLSVDDTVCAIKSQVVFDGHKKEAITFPRLLPMRTDIRLSLLSLVSFFTCRSSRFDRLLRWVLSSECWRSVLRLRIPSSFTFSICILLREPDPLSRLSTEFFR